MLGLLTMVNLLAMTPETYQFETIDTDDGLSLNSVMSVVRDKYGFMWFGTEDGLNRYDGRSFKVFRHDPLDSTSLNSSSVLSTLVDSQGNLWVGTYVSGLNRYDYRTESFQHYPADPLDSLALGDGSIYAMTEDHLGQLWIGTAGHGLYRLDPETGQSTPLKQLVNGQDTLSNPVIFSLFEDHTHYLWIATLDGLNVLDLNTYALRIYTYDPNDPGSLFDSSVNTIFETFDGQEHKIWIGTTWGGLDEYDPVHDRFLHHGYLSTDNPDYPETNAIAIIQESTDRFWVGTDTKGMLVMDLAGKLVQTIGQSVYDPTTLNDDAIQMIYDEGDLIWIGTASGGVSKYGRNRKQFYSLYYDPLNPDGLFDNRVLRIQEDSRGNLWIATWTSGLTYFDRTKHTFQVFQHNAADPASLSDNAIQDILIDGHDNLWVITASPFLDVRRSGTTEFVHIQADSNDPQGLQSEYLRTIYEDPQGLLWIGSWGDGLFKLDPVSMRFDVYRSPAVNKISLGTLTYYTLFEDSRGMLWIGAENEGLIGFDREHQSLKQFKSADGDPLALPNNDVMCFYEDAQGIIWLGTYGGGLTEFDPVNNTFTSYNQQQGLLSDVVYAIFEDAHGYLWMSTNNGLARFDKQQHRFKTYNASDGVLSKEFNPAACQDHKGWLLFGGVKGITYFDPLAIKENTHIPEIRFTGLSIMNHPIMINRPFENRVVLNRSLVENPAIELYPRDLFLNIQFASLDYYHPTANLYAYQLEGFDDTWRYIGHQNNVTFSSLPPGAYTLRVKGSNNDGLWNTTGTALSIRVYPHFYETWWFYFSLLVVFGTLAITGYKYRTTLLIRRSQELEAHNIRLNAEITSRRKAHRRARERAEYFRAVIAQAPTPMAIHNLDGNITHLNAGWVDFWQAENAENIIRDYQVDTDPLAQQLGLGESFQAALAGEVIVKPEVSCQTADGTARIVHVLLYPLSQEGGSSNQVMITLDEITEIVQNRQMLEKSIREQELLMKEVHHRVKNNLQIIASLLGLQKAGLKDPSSVASLEEFRNRVNSMALVHDALYRSADFGNIDIDTYIQGLVTELKGSFMFSDLPVQLNSHIPELNLSVELAIPCGLMINELVTNALKYAFPDPDQTDQQIDIIMVPVDNDRLRLEVLDNGVGFSQPAVWDSVHSLGLYLVKMLSEQQLMGSVELRQESGAHFIIEFPLHPNFDS